MTKNNKNIRDERKYDKNEFNDAISEIKSNKQNYRKNIIRKISMKTLRTL